MRAEEEKCLILTFHPNRPIEFTQFTNLVFASIQSSEIRKREKNLISLFINYCILVLAQH